MDHRSSIRSVRLVGTPEREEGKEESGVKEVSVNELLEEEQRRLDDLEENLARSKEITHQMFGLVDRFHERLNELEAHVMPVYSSTKKTRGIYNSK